MCVCFSTISLLPACDTSLRYQIVNIECTVSVNSNYYTVVVCNLLVSFLYLADGVVFSDFVQRAVTGSLSFSGSSSGGLFNKAGRRFSLSQSRVFDPQNNGKYPNMVHDSS